MCFGYLLDQGCTKYNRTADAGLNKVRKAKRVDGCAFEIKWHRPDAEVLHCFIQKDLARTAVAA